MEILEWIGENLAYIFVGGITLFIILCAICSVFDYARGYLESVPPRKMTPEEKENFDRWCYENDNG